MSSCILTLTAAADQTETNRQSYGTVDKTIWKLYRALLAEADAIAKKMKHRGRNHRNSFEIALFGAASVGKTSLVRRSFNGEFEDEYTPTVEDYYSHEIHQNCSVTVLNATDCAGSFQFPAMRQVTIRRAAGAVLVFSLDSEFSFRELHRILDEVIRTRGEEGIPVVVVGNKKDLDQREVAEEEVAELIRKYSSDKVPLRYVETSAKDNFNVDEVFNQLLRLMMPEAPAKKSRFKIFNFMKAKEKCNVM